MLFKAKVLLDPCDEFYRELITFSNGYPVIGKEYLHRIITECPVDFVVDHINGNRLDARRSNLRVCTQAQNNLNKVKTSAKVTSKYKGVSWRKSHSKWQATIYVNKVQKHLGYFNLEVQAALMYDIAAKKLHKTFSNLNFNLELT